MAYNEVKKSYTNVFKKKILSPEVWEEEILSHTKSPTVFLIFRFARFSGVVPTCSKVFPYVRFQVLEHPICISGPVYMR